MLSVHFQFFQLQALGCSMKIMIGFFQKFKIGNAVAAWAIPLAVFGIAISVFWGLMFQNGCGSLDPFCWKRWDSSLYLEIAEKGYTLIPCSSEMKSWCGNAGWAPLYPLIIKVVSNWLGLSAETAGVLVSHLAFLAALMVATNLAGIKDFSLRNWLTILLFAFFPGCVYYLAIFPVSLLMLAYLMVILGLKSDRPWLTGIGGGIAALSYSSGFFIAVPIFVFGVVRLLENRSFKGLALSILPVLMALVGWFTFFHFKLGHWNALFLVQEKYGHGIYSPIKMLFTHLGKAGSFVFTPISTIETQTIFVFLIAVIFLWSLLRKIWQGERAPFSFFWLAYILVLWFLPFSMGENISLYRGCVFLAPLVLFQGLWPVQTSQLDSSRILLLALFLFFAFRMSLYFFDKTLI